MFIMLIHWRRRKNQRLPPSEIRRSRLDPGSPAEQTCLREPVLQTAPHRFRVFWKKNGKNLANSKKQT